MKKYDVIIIGAGPAGIFAALELAAKNKLRVLILEKGRDISQRSCPREGQDRCLNCSSCSIVSGWGGAGSFSDGKLTLTTEFGGWLDQYQGRSRVQELINYVDGIYCHFGAPDNIFGTDLEEIRNIQRQAARADLALIRQNQAPGDGKVLRSPPGHAGLPGRQGGDQDLGPWSITFCGRWAGSPV